MPKQKVLPKTKVKNATLFKTVSDEKLIFFFKNPKVLSGKKKKKKKFFSYILGFLDYTLTTFCNHVVVILVLSDVYHDAEVNIQWCDQRSEHYGICDGSETDCVQKGKELCNTLGSGCFGVLIHSGWTAATKGVMLCTNNVMVPKNDWTNYMKKYEGTNVSVFVFLIKFRFEKMTNQR